MNKASSPLKMLALLLFFLALISIPAIGQDPTTIYFADARESPGKVYSTDASGVESTYFARPSGNIYTFSFHPYVPEKLYYVNANDNKIYLAVRAADGTWTTVDQVVYTHNTYVRDLEYYASSSGGLQIYFSESSGARANGEIYLLSGGAATPYYTVRLSDVDGFWAGDFIHDTDGNLYLSSGNRIPASIYKVSGGAVTRIYTSNAAPITGMAYLDGSIYYANWGNEIHRLDLSTFADTVFRSQPRHTWISDVGFAPFSALSGGIAGTSLIGAEGLQTSTGKISSGIAKKTVDQLNPQPEPPIAK
jgi:hypothetical protein